MGQLPLVPLTRALLEQLVDGRRAGFVFLNEPFAAGRTRPARAFASPAAFRAYLATLVAGLEAAQPGAAEREKRRVVTLFSGRWDRSRRSGCAASS